MKGSLLRRIILPTAIFMILLPVCTYFAFGVVANRFTKELARADLMDSLESARAIVQRVYGQYDKEEPAPEVSTPEEEKERAKEMLVQARTALKRGQFASEIIVLSHNQRVLFPTQPDQETQAILAAFSSPGMAQPLGDAQPEFHQISCDTGNYMACKLRVSDPEGIRYNDLVVYNSIGDVTSLMQAFSLFVFFITAILSLAAIFVSYSTARSIAHPMGKLCRHMEEIGKGNFVPTRQTSTIREVQSLIEATNAMAQRLERYDQAQKTFFQNASHELRTPLMSIQGYAEGIECGVWSDPVEAAGVIAGESRRLTGLVDELLTLSRIDNDQLGMEIEEIDLSVFLDNTLERLQGMSLSREVALNVLPGPRNCLVAADEQLLIKSVENVLSNALRYARSKVNLSVREEGDKVILRVADDGPGVAPENRERIFDRFFKGEEGHCGIGLSVARSSMRYMGGDVQLAPSDKGAAFDLIFVKAG